MGKTCQLTGKKPQVGNWVSHSNRKTKRRFNPNLQDKKFYVPELGRYIRLRVSNKAIRTINKKGIYPYIKALEKQGKKIL
jgi:large subunit ribosomal protein L28